jgi:small subunit ribosomal protein S16
MLMIRFMRIGRKNQPSFKIVVTEKTKSSTGGRFVEEVGFYNPATKEKVLKGERIKHWISVGAQPSPTIHNLLVAEKIIEGKKLPKHKIPKKPQESAPQTAPQSPQATPQTSMPSTPPSPAVGA